VHVDLIETLRCPRPHEESWLVATFERMSGRQVVEGRLGCPVCRAEFRIADGAVRFDTPAAAETAAEPRTAPPPSEPHDAALRLAALLGLAEGSGVVVLAGSWSREGPAIAELVPDHHLLLLNPSEWRHPVDEAAQSISVVVAPGRVPVAAGSLRGVALDERNAGAVLAADAVRALRAGGRLVAPASSPLPDGVGELARDDTVWVAERREAPRLVPLGRGGGR
jgi:uncharacterized protein YbaR (Trm112 family)